ncbi:uncharacterized protein LOC114649927 [Erpetoichthys calabaricus]|uniref:uncharacterized protein LOC114649927 n=1 Tax=Erpetoichthys calabaricus TaxID=27687 RepID=UPI002234ACBA|nr:uncharacterized protein LOC114649927 [Erpetoichthys calabaricus]
MWLLRQIVVLLLLIEWLFGVNVLTVADGPPQVWGNEFQQKVKNLSNEGVWNVEQNVSSVSPVLLYHKQVTSNVVRAAADGDSVVSELADVELVDVSLNIIAADQNVKNAKLVRLINRNKIQVISTKLDVPVAGGNELHYGANFEVPEMLQDSEEYNSDHSADWYKEGVEEPSYEHSAEWYGEGEEFRYDHSAEEEFRYDHSAEGYGEAEEELQPGEESPRSYQEYMDSVMVAPLSSPYVKGNSVGVDYSSFQKNSPYWGEQGRLHSSVGSVMSADDRCSKVAVASYPRNCGEVSMSAQFYGSSHDLKVRLHSSLVQASSVAHQCKYKVVERKGLFIFSTYYDGCNVKKLNGCYYLTLSWQSKNISLACPPKPIGSELLPAVFCSKTSMTVGIDSGSLDRLKVKDSHFWVPVSKIARECKYEVLTDSFGKIFFTASYKGCHVKKEGNYYVLAVQYAAANGKESSFLMKCQTKSGEQVSTFPFVTAPPEPGPKVSCHASTMDVVLPDAAPDQVKVRDETHHEVSVQQLAKKCQYTLVKRGHHLVFTANYKSCYVSMKDNNYILTVVYMPRAAHPLVIHMKCPVFGPPTSVTPITLPNKPGPVCRVTGMSVALPFGSPDQVKVLDKNQHPVLVNKAPKSCGYILLKRLHDVLFEAPYKACHVQLKNNYYTLTVLYKPAVGAQIVVNMKCPLRWHPTFLPTTPTKPITPRLPLVTCGASSMSTELPEGLLDQVKLLGKLGKVVVVSKAPKQCSYQLIKGKGKITFSASYEACDVRVEGLHYILTLIYKPASGKQMTVYMRCPIKETTPTTTTKPLLKVDCYPSSMSVVLPDVSPNDVQVVDERNRYVKVMSAPKTCGYVLAKKVKLLVFTTTYKGCHVAVKARHYVLEVLYKSFDGKTLALTMECPVSKIPTPPMTTLPTHPPPMVSCTSSNMSVVLPVGSPEHVKILGLHLDEVLLSSVHKECGYKVIKSKGKIALTVLYSSCNVHKEGNFFVLNIRYYPSAGFPVALQMKCPDSHLDPTLPTMPSPVVSSDHIISCKRTSMMVEFPYGKLEDIQLIDKTGKLVAVQLAPKRCGYRLLQAGGIFLSIPYSACDVQLLGNHYVLLVVYKSARGGQKQIEVRCPVREPSHLGNGVSCQEDCMSIDLPAGPAEQVQVVDQYHNPVSVKQFPRCGYNLSSEVGKLHFSASYKACHVKIQNGNYILTVLYTTSTGRHEVQMTCPIRDLVFHQGCTLPRKKQVQCGPVGISPSICRLKGCCVDAKTSHCFYPMDTCTADGHFVFAVYRTSSKPEVDPGSLYVSSNSSCAPVVCTPDFAIFKFPLTGCGTHKFVIGQTSIYLADVFGQFAKNRQMYGQILRHAPYRYQVECRYSKGSTASAGYMVVNTPTVPSIVSSETMGVVLRIAKDDSYTTFFPETQVPLRLLLGSQIYLDVTISHPPSPDVVLLVHYCIAYPRSSENVWVLMYNGCPNPLDYGTALHLKDHDQQNVPKHSRRFAITTFQFLDAKKENLLDEEIYFMCSTEVCSPEHQRCIEGCFDGRPISSASPSNWGKLCAGKSCSKRPHPVKRAVADGVHLLFLRDDPYQQTENWTTTFPLAAVGLLMSIIFLCLGKLACVKYVQEK